MIYFEPIASSSAGNCYRISDGSSSLLLECGINIQDIQKSFHFRLSSVDGALLTHEHVDHSKSVEEVAKKGINVYMSEGTKNALGINHHRIKTVEPRQTFTIGNWKILPFEVEHDSNEPFGYLIQNAEGEKLLFVTDTYYIRYKFKGLNYIAVECNYSEKLLEENILAGEVPIVMKKRLMKSHFSLENYKEFLQANDLSEVREIWLLHMSNTNSDAVLFKKELEQLTGKPIYVAN